MTPARIINRCSGGLADPVITHHCVASFKTHNKPCMDRQYGIGRDDLGIYILEYTWKGD